MYYNAGNHGYIAKTDMFYAKQQIWAEISETPGCLALLISQSH